VLNDCVVYREVEERGEVMWGREFKFIGMDPKNKGDISLVLDTKRERQMSFLKGGRCRDTFTIVYYIERERVYRDSMVFGLRAAYIGES